MNLDQRAVGRARAIRQPHDAIDQDQDPDRSVNRNEFVEDEQRNQPARDAEDDGGDCMRKESKEVDQSPKWESSSEVTTQDIAMLAPTVIVGTTTIKIAVFLTPTQMTSPGRST